MKADDVKEELYHRVQREENQGKKGQELHHRGHGGHGEEHFGVRKVKSKRKGSLGLVSAFQKSFSVTSVSSVVKKEIIMNMAPFIIILVIFIALVCLSCLLTKGLTRPKTGGRIRDYGQDLHKNNEDTGKKGLRSNSGYNKMAPHSHRQNIYIHPDCRAHIICNNPFSFICRNIFQSRKSGSNKNFREIYRTNKGFRPSMANPDNSHVPGFVQTNDKLDGKDKVNRVGWKENNIRSSTKTKQDTRKMTIRTYIIESKKLAVHNFEVENTPHLLIEIKITSSYPVEFFLIDAENFFKFNIEQEYHIHMKSDMDVQHNMKIGLSHAGQWVVAIHNPGPEKAEFILNATIY